MNFRSEMNRLGSALTARERGILVLRAMKEKTPEDPMWRLTMPPNQLREFNNYIALMKACNTELSFLITFVEQEVEKLELRLGWLFTLHVWQLNLAEIDFAAALVARESITESEYAEKVRQAENQYMAVRDLAVLLVEDRRAWKDEEVEQVSWTRELIVRQDIWERLVDEAEQELREMGEAGELESRRRGKRLEIRCGSFDAWMGRPASVFPQYANAYHVIPDDRAAHVEADRRTLGYLQDAIRRTPLSWYQALEDEGCTVEGLAREMATVIENGLKTRWIDLVAIEKVVEEVRAEFEGEDPLKPFLRKALERTKDQHQSIRETLAKYGHEVELPETSDEDFEDVRRLVYRHLI